MHPDDEVTLTLTRCELRETYNALRSAHTDGLKAMRWNTSDAFFAYMNTLSACIGKIYAALCERPETEEQKP